jgi:hypothetical protein
MKRAPAHRGNERHFIIIVEGVQAVNVFTIDGERHAVVRRAEGGEHGAHRPPQIAHCGAGGDVPRERVMPRTLSE